MHDATGKVASWWATLAAILWTMAMAASQATASVNLELKPMQQTVLENALVDIGLFAVWDGTGDRVFSVVDVVLTWESAVLELRGVLDNGPHNWNFMFGFKTDEPLDGLNADCGAAVFCDPYTGLPFNDGDAFFQALSFSEATATVQGLLIATFQFAALADTSKTSVVIEPDLGGFSRSQVLKPGAINVTGLLGSASLTIIDARLSVADLTIPAGRVADIVVSGEIFNQETLGVIILLELIPRPPAVGTVTFTPAAGPGDVDIALLDDPWDGAGSFELFDTNLSGSESRNGAVLDNGMVGVPTPVTFSGQLAGFPILPNEDARGAWDVRLTLDGGVVSSTWDSLDDLLTALNEGVLVVVALYDGDGSETVDMRDFSEFSACFTGPVGFIDPPAYPMEAELRCSVYDSNGDGDVDEDDFTGYLEAMSGP